MQNELFESFKTSLEGVNGDLRLVKKEDLAKTVLELYKENDVTTVSIALSELLEEVKLVEVLRDGGITVHTDHIRLHAETDKGGISEGDHGIAELGTLVQESDDVDKRIVSTMAEYYIGVIRGSKIVKSYDDMFDILSEMDELPNFVGFITGPSRTADIECVGTVGVHGPVKLSIVIVEDM